MKRHIGRLEGTVAGELECERGTLLRAQDFSIVASGRFCFVAARRLFDAGKLEGDEEIEKEKKR